MFLRILSISEEKLFSFTFALAFASVSFIPRFRFTTELFFRN